LKGNKYHANKDEAKEIYFDFIDEPENSPRRREGDGIYGSYFIGENKRVKLILLDLRYELDSFGGEDMLGK
jgi:alkaline phosphatase D